jgi:hypothetical protein
MPSVTSYCVWKYSEEDLDAAEGYDKDTEDEAQQLARDIIAQGVPAYLVAIEKICSRYADDGHLLLSVHSYVEVTIIHPDPN